MPTVFAPTSPAASHYGDPVPVTAELTETAAAILGSVAAAAEAQGVKAPRFDGRLALALTDLAALTATLPEGRRLPYRLVEFALTRQGVIEPSPQLFVIWVDQGDSSDVVGQLAPAVRETLQNLAVRQVAVGQAYRNGSTVYLLGLQTRYLETNLIPRSVPADQPFTLSGRILEPFDSPEVSVTRHSGLVETSAMQLDEDGRFQVEISCGDEKGQLQIAFAAERADEGSVTLANFPVWCGEAPPRTVPTRSQAQDEAPVTSPEAAEARSVALINHDRERFGLAPYIVDPTLTSVARAHAREMARTGHVSSISPTNGRTIDRVRAAGIVTDQCFGNVMRVYSIDDMHEGIMGSPSTRKHVLSSVATHVGVGAAFGGGRDEMFVSEIFVLREPANAEGTPPNPSAQ